MKNTNKIKNVLNYYVLCNKLKNVVDKWESQSYTWQWLARANQISAERLATAN